MSANFRLAGASNSPVSVRSSAADPYPAIRAAVNINPKSIIYSEVVHTRLTLVQDQLVGEMGSSAALTSYAVIIRYLR